MKKNKIEKTENLNVGKKQSHIIRKIFLFFGIAVILAALVFFSYFFISRHFSKKNHNQHLKRKME